MDVIESDVAAIQDLDGMTVVSTQAGAPASSSSALPLILDGAGGEGPEVHAAALRAVLRAGAGGGDGVGIATSMADVVLEEARDRSHRVPARSQK